ncbi:MAG: GyrI-like domain-containing protein [Pseudomonadota bacterium]
MLPVEIEVTPVYRLAALPHTGPYDSLGSAYDLLANLLTERGLWPKLGHMMGVHYDDPRSVESEALRSHAGAQVVDDDFPMAPPLETVVVPAGRHAVMRYQGPYEGLSKAWDSLVEDWLPTSGEEMGEGPAFEIYLNSPQDTAPEDLRTDIYLALA